MYISNGFQSNLTGVEEPFYYLLFSSSLLSEDGMNSVNGYINRIKQKLSHGKKLKHNCQPSQQFFQTKRSCHFQCILFSIPKK